LGKLHPRYFPQNFLQKIFSHKYGILLLIE
jgi:hypothetical protein